MNVIKRSALALVLVLPVFVRAQAIWPVETYSCLCQSPDAARPADHVISWDQTCGSIYSKLLEQEAGIPRDTVHESCEAMVDAAAPFCSPGSGHEDEDDASAACGAVKTAEACGSTSYTTASTCVWATYACDWSGDEYNSWGNKYEDYCGSVGEPCCNAGFFGDEPTWLGSGVVVDPETCLSASTDRDTCKSTLFAEQCQGGGSGGECYDLTSEEDCDAAEFPSVESCVWKEPQQSVLAPIGSHCCTQCGSTFGPKAWDRDSRSYDCVQNGLMMVADPATPCGGSSAGDGSCTFEECCVPDPDLTACDAYGAGDGMQLSTNCCAAVTQFMQEYADSDGKMEPDNLSSAQKCEVALAIHPSCDVKAADADLLRFFEEEFPLCPNYVPLVSAGAPRGTTNAVLTAPVLVVAVVSAVLASVSSASGL